MAVAVEEKTSTEGAYSIYDSNEWDNEVIHQAIQEHQYHLTDRQKRYVGIKRVIDTCIAAVVLLILAIPFLFVAILQKSAVLQNPYSSCKTALDFTGRYLKSSSLER